MVKFFMPAICWLLRELFQSGGCKIEIRIITEQNEQSRPFMALTNICVHVKGIYCMNDFKLLLWEKNGIGKIESVEWSCDVLNGSPL
jgi:hypothetical protein